MGEGNVEEDLTRLSFRRRDQVVKSGARRKSRKLERTLRFDILAHLAQRLAHDSSLTSVVGRDGGKLEGERRHLGLPNKRLILDGEE